MCHYINTIVLKIFYICFLDVFYVESRLSSHEKESNISIPAIFISLNEKTFPFRTSVRGTSYLLRTEYPMYGGSRSEKENVIELSLWKLLYKH